MKIMMIYVLKTETHRRHNFTVTHYAYFTDEGEAFDAIEMLAGAAREASGETATHVEWTLMETETGKLFDYPTVTRAGSVFLDDDIARAQAEADYADYVQDNSYLD